MNARSFPWIPLALMVSLAAGSFWLLNRSQLSDETAPMHHGGIDFWAENFTIRRHGDNGALQHILTATRMTHNATTDISYLTAPLITWVSVPKMTIKADTGEVTAQGETVDFKGNVNLNRDAAPGKSGSQGAPLHIRSEHMRVKPNDETAEGQAAVRIVQGNNVVTGASYRVNGKTGASVIDGRVRATIAPKKS
jgi:lipopolysaccharide export system protein LptC